MKAATVFDAFAPAKFQDCDLLRRVERMDPLPESVRQFARYLQGVTGTPAKVRAWILALLAPDGPPLGGRELDVTVSPRGVVTLRLGETIWPVVAFHAADPAEPTCRMCGCTAELGCAGGCSWESPGLCTACAPHLLEFER